MAAKKLEGKEVQQLPQPPKPHYTRRRKKTNILTWGLAIAAILIVFNQLQVFQINSMIAPASASHVKAGGSLSFSAAGNGTILAPMLLASGEQPAIPGYQTRIKQLPTISAGREVKPTGDAVQDAVNSIVPTGTPWYGQEAGVSFDDPINAQHVWSRYERALQLTAEQQQRWAKIVGSFTCDYCCGSPQRPTIITRCGCAHAGAWRGMAAWFIKNYGDKYTDEQIFGEMSKWKALWYPGPTVQRVLQEQASGSGGSGVTDINKLPSMVGGC